MRNQSIKAATAKNEQTREWRHEAQCALRFWQALEYLAPQSPPDPDPAENVWEVGANTWDKDVPWRDASKQDILKTQHLRWRFQVFCGIAEGRPLLEEARKALGGGALDLEERRPPSSAACVMLEVNSSGMATGEVFISTLPWAMALIVKHGSKNTPIDFRGFFGMDGMQEKIQLDVRVLLAERKLVRIAQSDAKAPVVTAASDDRPAVTTCAADELRTLAAEDIEAVEELIFEQFGWRPSEQKRWRVKAVMESADGSKKASDDPLNSFYAEDLERVSQAFGANDFGAGLQAYLQGEDSCQRIDLERETSDLIAGVLPRHLPLGAWPAKHPMVTAQQFAVNKIIGELSASSGIFSVNGPPGTGKTTMLKDIVAAVVVSRADVMATYAQPASAFRKDLAIDRYGYKAYALDEKLRGFGIVVASANNGAVENISKELPGLADIAEEFEVDFFSIVADSIAAPKKPERRKEQRENWGMIAAVLGNKENRNNFAQRFWFSDMADKKARAKAREQGKELPPLDPLRLRSLQSVFDDREHGAMDWQDARLRYHAAREHVQKLTDEADTLAHAVGKLDTVKSRRLTCAHTLALLTNRLPALQSAFSAIVTASNAAGLSMRTARERLDAYQYFAETQRNLAGKAAELTLWQSKLPRESLASLRVTHADCERRYQELIQQYEQHMGRRPGLMAQIFRTRFSERWNQAGELLEEASKEAKVASQAAASAVALAESVMLTIADVRVLHTEAQAKLASAQERLRTAGVAAEANTTTLEADFRTCMADAARLKQSLAIAKEKLDDHARQVAQYTSDRALADEEISRIEAAMAASKLDQETLAEWSLACLDREALHRAAPYFMPALFAARRDLFVAAMELHKSFIVASWPKLKPTLSAFVNLLSGSIRPGQVQAGPMALWDTFFLVVPIISTTFASFPRLLTGVEREQLAWLLIDEAGQASPQQAVGAIWRSRRTVVVGDPLQLEPVVEIPDELVTPLLVRCAAEKQWAPPTASVQILADRANRYGTYLGEEDERVWLGAPLVVHRRCLDPMFQIANAIAYNGLMVYGVAPDRSPGWPSCWINCSSNDAEGHWVQMQGDVAMRLVATITQGELRAPDGKYKVYIITPFRKVAERLRQMLYKKYGEQSGKMSGTVHTFQGKEADNVIFVLGGDPARPGVISSFAGAKPNLVNVAVTRAKRRLYVVGDHQYWTGPHDIRGFFGSMAKRLPFHSNRV